MDGISRTCHTLWCQSWEVVPSLPQLVNAPSSTFCLPRTCQSQQDGLLLHGFDSKGWTGPRELGQRSCAPSSKAGLPMVVQTLSFMTGVPRTEQALECQVGEAVPQSSTTGLSRPCQALWTQAGDAHPPLPQLSSAELLMLLGARSWKLPPMASLHRSRLALGI